MYLSGDEEAGEDAAVKPRCGGCNVLVTRSTDDNSVEARGEEARDDTLLR